MAPRLPAVLACLALAACAPEIVTSEPQAFVGSWDCGVEIFRFTDSTYNDGTATYPIRAVTRDGRDYLLRFANGYSIALVAVTATGLTWISGASGDQLNCRRVN